MALSKEINFFGTLIFEKRKKEKLSQQNVGDMIGEDKSYISKLENGLKYLSNKNQLTLMFTLWGGISYYNLDSSNLFIKQGRNKYN